jgi:hypothetical protein
MNKKNIIEAIKVSVLSLIIVSSVSVTYAVWQSAPQNPPACDTAVYPGCNPPINVSATPQYKQGALALGKTTSPIVGADLDVQGIASVGALAIAGDISIGGGTPADGMVLTAVDATGLAQWETPAAATPSTDFSAVGSTITVDVGTNGQTKTVTVPNTPVNAKAVIGNWTRTSSCTNFFLKIKTFAGIDVGNVYSDIISTLPGSPASNEMIIIPLTNEQFKIQRVAALGSNACDGIFTVVGFMF